MASRLYPGFGSGKGSYEGTFTVKLLGQASRPELEAGDKVILPQAVFKEIKRLRLPFPLTFRARSTKAPGRTPSGKQRKQRTVVCGVYEFSGKSRTNAFVPRWVLRALRIKEGQQAVFTTIPTPPKATFARFRPHRTAMIEEAAAFGPREYMEAAMRNYSALVRGTTILVSLGGGADNYMVDVMEVQPDVNGSSLYGDCDLEVDFAPPKDQEDDGSESVSAAEVVQGGTATPVPAANAPQGIGWSAAAAAEAVGPSAGGLGRPPTPIDREAAAMGSRGSTRSTAEAFSAGGGHTLGKGPS